MDKKKLVLTLLGVVIVILLAVAGMFYANDMKQKNQLIDEVNAINKLTQSSDLDLNAIKEKLSTEVTKGDYLVLEKAVKAYLGDVVKELESLLAITQDEKIATLLSADNYKADGPDFVETKAYITEKKTQLENIKNNVKELLTQEKIMTYIDGKDLNAHYTNIYKQLAYSDNDASQQEDVTAAIDTLINSFNTSEEIINFLIDNKGNWEVQGKNIVFNSNSLVSQYNTFLRKLK